MSGSVGSNVRESCRILATYQLQLMSILETLDHQLQQQSFDFKEWNSPYLEPLPRPEKWPGRTSVWAWLPFSHLEWSWQKGTTNKPGMALVFVEHVMDTILERNLVRTSAIQTDPVALIANEQEACTLLRAKWFVIERHGEAIPSKYWNQEWESTLESLLRVSINTLWPLYKETTPPQETTRDGFRAGSLAVSINDIETPQDLENFFLAPLLKHITSD